MKAVADLLPLWAATLAPGQSERSRCPSCQAPETSFVVTHKADGTLAWICHRASCGFRGSTAIRGNTPSACIVPAPPPVVSLDFSVAPKYGYYFDRNSAGYYFPIIGFGGVELGFQLRWYDGRRPKVKTYLYPGAGDAETMDWHVVPGADTAVIVEDIPSAAAVRNAGYMAVALLGTNFNAARAAELKTAGIRRLFFLLDRDAFDKSLRYVREWGAFFETGAIYPEILDPKDLPLQELKSKLEDSCGIQNTVGRLPPNKL